MDGWLASTLLLLLLCAVPPHQSVRADDELQATEQDEFAEGVSNEESNLDELGVAVIEQATECARTSQNGDLLKVYFTGYLTDGTVFSSSEENSPLAFVLGRQHVIKGFDQGLLDMCVGETRRLTIPPHLAYGQDVVTINGYEIGPSATMIFDVSLVEALEIDYSEESLNFENLDLDQDGVLSREEVKNYLWKLAMTADDIAIGMQTPQGQEKYVDNIMYNHDFDGDGFLTLEEFQTPIYGPRDEL